MKFKWNHSIAVRNPGGVSKSCHLRPAQKSSA